MKHKKKKTVRATLLGVSTENERVERNGVVLFKCYSMSNKAFMMRLKALGITHLRLPEGAWTLKPGIYAIGGEPIKKAVVEYSGL